jgi:hypothetical protein
VATTERSFNRFHYALRAVGTGCARYSSACVEALDREPSNTDSPRPGLGIVIGKLPQFPVNGVEPPGRGLARAPSLPRGAGRERRGSRCWAPIRQASSPAGIRTSAVSRRRTPWQRQKNSPARRTGRGSAGDAGRRKFRLKSTRRGASYDISRCGRAEA